MMERPKGGTHWSATHNSHFEPDKLQLVDFTRKREPPMQPGQRTVPLLRPPLKLGTQTIKPVQSYKYLGVILDQELRFKEHTNYTLAKGTTWVNQFWRLSRPTVGMPPRFARQLYKAIAVPRMLYAADIFLTPITRNPGQGRVTRSVGHIAKLARVQRTVALHITGAMRTTATDMIDAHAKLLPFHILVNQICYRSTLRLATLPDTHPLYKHMRKARRYVKRHRTPLHKLLHAFRIDPDTLETISTHRQAPGWIRQVKVRKAANKDEAYKEGMESTTQVKVYTDGSDINGGVGAAALLIRDGRRHGTLRTHLGHSSQHTIYEAELAGIMLAAHLLKRERHWQEAEIRLDSQAAIDALNLTRPAPSHYLADEIHKQLKAVRHEHPTAKLTMRWIPGHMGIEGNKLADVEAKKAADGDASPAHALPTMLHKPLPTSASAIKRTIKETARQDAATHLAKSKRYPRLKAIDRSVPSLSVRYKERYLKACAQLSSCRWSITQSFGAQLGCDCDKESMA